MILYVRGKEWGKKKAPRNQNKGDSPQVQRKDCLEQGAHHCISAVYAPCGLVKGAQTDISVPREGQPGEDHGW